jgi:hypothetical protein
MTEERKKRGRVEYPAHVPLPDDRIAWLRQAHRLEDPPMMIGTEPTCRECYRVWPCTIASLLVMIPEEARDEPATIEA